MNKASIGIWAVISMIVIVVTIVLNDPRAFHSVLAELNGVWRTRPEDILVMGLLVSVLAIISSFWSHLLAQRALKSDPSIGRIFVILAAMLAISIMFGLLIGGFLNFTSIT